MNRVEETESSNNQKEYVDDVPIPKLREENPQKCLACKKPGKVEYNHSTW